jgi:hypothetical protein
MQVGVRSMEVRVMDKEQKEVSKPDPSKDKKKAEETIPPCTIAPSAEHAGGRHDDEPCDDGREGKVDD